MLGKPNFSSGYSGEQTALVRATCLYVATKLGDLMDDLVLVGGLVPSLLIDQDALPPDVMKHVGTMDLDIGLSVVLLNAERYKASQDVSLRRKCHPSYRVSPSSSKASALALTV